MVAHGKRGTMRLRLAIPLLAATAGLIGVGCTSAPSAPGAAAGGTIPLLVAGDTASVTTLDAAKYGPAWAYGAMESLLTTSPAGKVEPWLAQSVSAPNPTTYVFHLRQGVRFWDGNEMTSADVVNALQYYSRPGSILTAWYPAIKNITADGPFTAVVTLQRPDAAFLAGLTYGSPIFEKKFQDEHKTTMGQPGVLIMGTGPFKIDSFDPTRNIQMSANPHWWGGKVNVQHVTIDFFSSETSEALAMRAGEIDVAFPQSGVSFASTSGAKVVSQPSNAVAYWSMNPHVAPWNNIHVRRAVAYALDRSAILKVLGNAAVPVSTFIPASELDTIAPATQVDAMLRSVPTYPHNLALARAELAQSPYPHGFSTSTTTLQFGFYTPVCETIAAELAKIGIKMSLKELSFSRWITYYDGPKTYGNLFVNDNEIYADPSAHPAAMIAAPQFNTSGWTTSALSSLVTAGLAATDNAKRLTIYGDIMKTVADVVPYVPLFNVDYNVVLRSGFAITNKFSIVYNFEQPWELYITRKTS
jgi:peptide/nickel transport system substrate-binding protein